MCRNFKHLFLVVLSMNMAAGQFSACASRLSPHNTNTEPSAKLAKICDRDYPINIGCVTEIIPYENEYAVKLKGQKSYLKIENAGEMEDSEMEILFASKDQQFPIETKILKDRILKIKKYLAHERN